MYVVSSFQDAEETDRSGARVVWNTVVQESNGLSQSAA